MKISVLNNESSVGFYCEKEEFSGVKKIADKVRLDVQRVTGAHPELIDDINNWRGDVVLYGTIDTSPLFKKLELEKKIDLSQIRGKRETYLFQVIKTPFFENQDITSAIIIIGSDKRGSIYGLFHLSELMGVSPLVDWAGIMPAHKDCITLEEGIFVSKEPSVRFRGFFINDEWPAFGNWANHNFGGFNAKMYEHVFELLLRLKGNYLWPAMWASRFSDDGPDLANAELADELGVIMGASHHEPCCRAGEEYKHLRGPGSIYGDAWNFRSNEAGITKFWEDGLKRSGKFENVITVGMRGEADTAIMKNATLKDNINLLRDVLKTQNSLIKKYVNEDIQSVPRMLALYKEVEPYFYGDKHTKGLIGDKELEGVTLMLCDDNHGNLRTVPTEQMRNHKGGYGMYYHFDYHGSPYSYEWVNTNFLPKVKEQMCTAYEFGIRELWIVNVGDILTTEFPLSYFLNLAYDYETYSAETYTTEEYTKQWVDFQFATLTPDQRSEICTIMNNYTKLANLRRTECITPDTFHPVNFSESNKIITQAEDIILRAEKLRNELGGELPPGFFSQVYFPACGTMNILRMQLYSGKNKWLAARNIMAANDYAKLVKNCYEYDKQLVSECDLVENGKFYAMGWSEHFGFTNWCEAANHYPTYTYVESTRKKRIVVWCEGDETCTTGQDWTNKNLYLNSFKNPTVNQAKVFIGSCFEAGVSYKTSLKNDNSENKWLTLKVEKQGQIDVIILSINRETLAKCSDKKEVLHIEGDDGHGARFDIFVNIDAQTPDCNYPSGTYIQTDRYISIEAPHYSNLNSDEGNPAWKILPNYGKTEGAVKVFPVINSYPKGKNAPSIEYNFVPSEEGVYSFDFFLNPSNPAYKDNKLQFIAEINGEKILKNVVDPDFAVGDNQEPWSTDVTNDIRISTVYADCKKGLNTLKLYPVTPNIVLEKIVISSAGTILPSSYLGAPESYRIK